MQSMVKSGLMILGAALVFAVFNGTSMAQDGKTLYAAKGCVACHGADGKAPIMPLYPKLAGQNSEYIQNQLKDFKAQKRTNGQAALMFGMAGALSDAEMKQIADFLAGVK